MFARSKTSGQGHGLTRRIVAFLGSLLTLALVLSTLGFIHPSQVQAAPVNNKEPYTIGLEYNYDSQDQSTCYVYDSNNGFCSKRDDNWAINRNPDIARLLVNTEDYPTTNGPLTVVLRVPRRDVVEITPQGSIGGKAAGSADPTVAHGFETIDGVGYTTLTISWEKFDAIHTSELVVPIRLALQKDVPNGVPFTLSAEATPGTAAQATNPPSLTFTVQYRQQAGILVHNAGQASNGMTSVIGASRPDTNGYLPTDVSSLNRSVLSLQVPSFAGAKGVRTAKSATVTWKLPEYGTVNGSRKPLVQVPENSEWTILADGSVTRTFTVPDDTDPSQYNAVLKREIEAAELSMYFPGTWDATDLFNLSATITYAPLHPAEGEKSIEASANIGLHITSAANNGVGEVKKFTNWDGWYSSRAVNDTQGERRKDWPWRLEYTNKSGLPVHHLVLTDSLPRDDTTFRLIGLQNLIINGFNPSKPECQSVDPNDATQSQCRGDITNVNIIQVHAYINTGDSDVYSGSQLTKTADGIRVRFNPAKTYVRFDIRLVNSDGSDYTVPVQTSITLTPITQFRNPEQSAYRDPPTGVSADTFNSHINNGSASGQFQLDNGAVPAKVVTAGASVVVKKFSEWLYLYSSANIDMGVGNHPLATIGNSYTHAVNLFANIEAGNRKFARLIVLLPSSFTPSGVEDLAKDKDGLSIGGAGAYGGLGPGDLVKSVSYRHNYAGGRNALIVDLNLSNLEKVQPTGHGDADKQMWTYISGSINSQALEGNTGTFDDYFTMDSAPIQSGEGTVPDTYHFGPNPNIVHSFLHLHDGGSREWWFPLLR